MLVCLIYILKRLFLVLVMIHLLTRFVCCLTTKNKSKEIRSPCCVPFFPLSMTLSFIPDCSQTLIYFQSYCLVYGLSWPLYFSPFPVCCMPISQFSNNIIKMWFVVTPISSTWGRCLGKKEFWNICLELGLKIFVKFIWLAFRGFGWEMLQLPVFYHG